MTVKLATLPLLLGICFIYHTTSQRPAMRPNASDQPLNEPAIFGAGVISTGEFDSHPAFMPDGKTLYFVRSTPNFNLWTILVSRFEKGKWNEPLHFLEMTSHLPFGRLVTDWMPLADAELAFQRAKDSAVFRIGIRN
jgi:hypothetical protein